MNNPVLRLVYKIFQNGHSTDVQFFVVSDIMDAYVVDNDIIKIFSGGSHADVIIPTDRGCQFIFIGRSKQWVRSSTTVYRYQDFSYEGLMMERGHWSHRVYSKLDPFAMRKPNALTEVGRIWVNNWNCLVLNLPTHKPLGGLCNEPVASAVEFASRMLDDYLKNS